MEGLLQEILRLLELIRYELRHHRRHHKKAAPSAPSGVRIREFHHLHRGHPMQAILTWTDPSTRADGTPLAAADIAFIDVLMSSDNGLTYASFGHAAAGQQTFTQELTAAGTYLFKLETNDTQVPPLVSADSTVVSVIVPAPALAAPSAPTAVTATLQPDPTTTAAALKKK